jgi:queuine tRNA-ribosyltransferase
MVGMRLAALHNVHFILNLVKTIREAIQEESFLTYKEEFLQQYSNNNPVQ